jgi:hypothetical protein
MRVLQAHFHHIEQEQSWIFFGPFLAEREILLRVLAT